MSEFAEDMAWRNAFSNTYYNLLHAAGIPLYDNRSPQAWGKPWCRHNAQGYYKEDPLKAAEAYFDKTKDEVKKWLDKERRFEEETRFVAEEEWLAREMWLEAEEDRLYQIPYLQGGKNAGISG